MGTEMDDGLMYIIVTRIVNILYIAVIMSNLRHCLNENLKYKLLRNCSFKYCHAIKNVHERLMMIEMRHDDIMRL